jgi:sortase A
MTTTRHWLVAAAPLAAAFFSLLIVVQAAWIPVKAELAQWLIARSWQVAAQGGSAPPPWPWADTRPAAVLQAPSQGIRQFVLEGTSGRNLAFGPVLLDGSLDGDDVVISGHRDTHFRFLSGLRVGDRLRLQTPAADRWFEISTLEVVDSRDRRLLIEPGRERLSLVTCFPFDQPFAGGPLRYVVTALPLRTRSPSSG